MSVSFLFYSHSENADLWPYIGSVTSKISEKFPIYIAIEESFKGTIPSFCPVITYNDTLTYDKKLISIFDKLTTKFVVLIHDNSLLVEFDNELFERLISVMDTNSIDRCIFGVAARDGPEKINLTDEDVICKTNTLSSVHFFLPYDVGPSIWNIKSYKEALELIPGTSYRDIEFSAIKNHCKNKLNIYGFITHKTLPSCYVVGRPFYPKFQFLHIFVRREIMYSQMYMDQENNFKRILELYPDIKKRAVHDQIINIHLRTV